LLLSLLWRYSTLRYYVMLPEVAAGICSRVFMFTFMILYKKMRGFAISLHFLCFAVVFVGEIHCLYEDQAGLFDW